MYMSQLHLLLPSLVMPLGNQEVRMLMKCCS